MSTSGLNFNVGESSNMTTCPFCGIIDGVTWLEYHLTGSTPCSQAPSSINQVLQFAKERHEHEQQGKNPATSASASGSRKRVKCVSMSNGNDLEIQDISFPPTGWMNEAKETICNFFTQNRFDFDALKSPTFHKMLSFFFGKFIPIPASDKLYGWILEYEASKNMNEVRSSWPETGSSILIDGEVSKYVNEVRSSWAETGSSILIDSWTNAESRNFLSVFVDSPKGTIYLRSFDVSDLHEDLEAMKLLFEQVIEEVGSSNVVQIVTYSNSVILKEIGNQIMDKYSSTFWTIDTSFCFDLMIENYGAVVSETLEKAKVITRFIYNHQVLKPVQVDADGNELVARSKAKHALPFFTLENLVLKKKLLKETFLSSRSEVSIITTSAEGKRVAKLVADKSFWTNAKIVITTVIPLVRAIELMNEKKSHMDCLYETMDQIKETIKEGLGSEELYKQYWNVIDKVWDDHLYTPLHSAGYFLNPTIYYSEDVSIDDEVWAGLFHCVYYMAETLRDVRLVTAQLELYRKPEGSFEIGSAVDKRSGLSPVEWWSKYGGECPELQKFAIRILSQTCSGASRLQLDRSLVENEFEERRNQTEREGASEKVSLLYNMQLQKFVSGASNRMMPGDEIDPVWVSDWTGVSHS